MQAESTTFVHDGVTMTEYEKQPFVIGDYNHAQIEFFDLSRGKWFTARVSASENAPIAYQIFTW